MNLIEHACRRLQQLSPHVHSVGLLATSGTTVTGLYHAPLESADIDLVVPDECAQASEVMPAINAIKAGHNAGSVLEDVTRTLVARGAQAIIAGCTEVAVTLRQSEVAVPVIDPAQVLAAEVLAWATDYSNRHAIDAGSYIDIPRTLAIMPETADRHGHPSAEANSVSSRGSRLCQVWSVDHRNVPLERDTGRSRAEYLTAQED